MEYYPIYSDLFNCGVCTIITTLLLICVMYELDIFQDQMHILISGIECACAYLDKLLVLAWVRFFDHLDNLEFLKTIR